MSVARLPEAELFVCYGCHIPKPPSAFQADERSVRGHRPTCRACHAARRKAQATRQRIEYLMSHVAPERAVVRLLKEHPHVMADIIHRHRQLYSPILEEERSTLLRQREAAIEGRMRREQ